MKKKTLKKWPLLLFLAFVPLAIHAQQTTANASALAQQIDYILHKSENYKDLKIVKTAWLENLKQHATSSYATLEREVSQSKALAKTQQAKIMNLQTQLEQTNLSLSKYTNTGPTVVFLGIEFDQIVFGSLFSILFFGSLILACIWAIKFNKANELTQNAQKVVIELQDEFQEHKRIAIEREQKISRQLQDELNKQKQYQPRKAS